MTDKNSTKTKKMTSSQVKNKKAQATMKNSAPYAKELDWTIFLNIAFALIEFVGGIFTNSLMLMTDASKDLGDSIGLIIAKIMDYSASQEKNSQYTYGYRRLALFSTFVSSMILLIVAATMTPYAINRLFKPEVIDILPVIWLAVPGCIVHAMAIIKFKTGKSADKKLAFFNLTEDLLMWLLVLTTSLLIYMFKLPVLDTIMSLVMIVFMLATSMRNFYVVLKTFLQGVPANIDLDKIKYEIEKLPYVNELGDFHIWALTEGENISTLILKIDKDLTWRRRLSIKKGIVDILAQNQILDCTIELDETKNGVAE